MKTTNGVFLSVLAFTIISTTVLLFKSIPDNTCYQHKLSQEQEEMLENFRHICELNEMKIDSFKQIINKDFNYPYHFTASFKKEGNRDFEIRSIYDVPYYGMTDGYNGFIFSLHAMKVKKIHIHWAGGSNFYAYNEFSFFDDDFIDFDLHTFNIRIPEHDKVVKEIEVRCKEYTRQLTEYRGSYCHFLR